LEEEAPSPPSAEMAAVTPEMQAVTEPVIGGAEEAPVALPLAAALSQAYLDIDRPQAAKHWQAPAPGPKAGT